ncbi:hypothetical protein GF314_05705 [bacterium]|nr:hypothetical protein [bacterium]
MIDPMTLSEASLADLVAELRKRLRRFVDAPGRGADVPREPGPLGPAGRSALALRLLAAALGQHADRGATAAAAALEDLAATLGALPDPIGDPRIQAQLEELMTATEDMARAWDRAPAEDVAPLWARVRRVADGLWGGPEAPSTTPPTAGPTPPGKDPPTRALREVWLLVAGEVRRAALTRRLEQAGARVVSPADAPSLVERLRAARPDLVVCDDAAPTRHHRQLCRLLPDDAPPLVVVQGARPAGSARPGIWAPPYRTRDLLSALGA